MLPIHQNLSAVLGDRTAKALEKYLAITSVGELIEHFPRRYSKRGELTPISSLPVGELVSVVGEVVATSTRRIKGKPGSILEVLVTDGEQRITLAFFNQAWRQKDLHPGARGLFSGKISSFSGKLQLTHPDYELFEAEIDPAQAKAWADLPIPIYPATSTLTTWKIQKSIQLALSAMGAGPELLDAQLLADRGLVPLAAAISQIHEPKTDSDWQAARESLKFHEAMLLQLEIARRRAELGEQFSSKRIPGELLGVFDKLMPFQLTEGQSLVCSQIESDLASGKPMHRLLQGEVGSGKTIVALRAVLTVAESGGQSAILAPTEVLASQHFSGIVETLGPDLAKSLGVRLLTGSMPLKDRKQALLDMASGKCLLAIGTHALISNAVQFADLSFVVIDEQHRFGVNQRETLKGKGQTVPHVLTMTATPIPRTLAITVFGDLDVSSLTELPAGRKEIKTHVVPVGQPALVSRVWQRVAEEVAAGRQAFVVCPRIEGSALEEGDSEELEIEAGPAPAAAVEVFEALKPNPALAGVSIGLLHGRQSSEEKASVMQAFAAGEISVLVSTTVIEVGVNVPNATAMVILDADRFGISQLHQLRGRVGRGAHAGICLLVSGAEPGTLAHERLDAVAGTLDGFELSERDLELRGEGDVLSNLQSGGRSGLKLLRVIQDAALIAEVKPLAESLLAKGLSEPLALALQSSTGSQLTQS
jgi:ATP-dependent DNA helicase RecG